MTLNISHDEIAGVFATFEIDDSTITYDADEEGGSNKVGLAVALTAGYLLETVGDGEEVLGKLVGVEADGAANVQVGGFMTLPGGSGATLTPGKKIVGDLGPSSAEGYIREVATGTAAELGVARGMIINASDTDEVVVYLA